MSKEYRSNTAINDMINNGVPFPSYGFKNYIINGGFDVWQRGVDLSVTNSYTADRWLNQSVDTVRFREHELTSNMTSAWGVSKGMLITTTATTTVGQIQQRIEGVDKFSNKDVTVSFGMSAAVVGTYTIKLRANFGIGGSAPLFLGVYTFTNASSYAIENISHTFSIPDILTAYTLGTSHFLQLEIYYGTDTLAIPNNSIYISKLQLEEGSVATPFEQRPVGLELSLCQRYYETFDINTGGSSTYKYGAGTVTSALNGVFSFCVAKRVVPSLQLVGTVLYANCSALIIGATTKEAVSFVNITATGSYRAYNFSLIFSAEL